ncbi:MAG: hypothetical protein HUJ68_09350 [Clostridia bacterium]|nr:hypothetical protein [Clostridia bacterium]
MNFFKTLLLTSFIFILISCGSTPNVEKVDAEAPETTESVKKNTENQFDEDDVIDIEETVQIKTVVEPDDEEYIRSTNNLSTDEVVTREEFIDDKAEILRIISELQKIMDKGDVNAWLQYISPDSIKYYSNPANIRKAQKKLPNKTIVLNGIGDYFKFVFIPSRKRSEVQEIRYISKTNIKAVDIKDDGSIIVYYQFVKINNKWLVHIPSL